MANVRTSTVTFLLVILVLAGPARAGTRLGADDAGFVPPDATIFACENTVEKHFAKLIGGTGACHLIAARMGVRGKAFDEEACETNARARYDRATAGLTGCPSCLDAGGYAAAEMGRIDTVISTLVYCDSTSGALLGDADDLGWVPADATRARCQNRTARRLGHLAETLVGCHIRLAATAFRSGTPDDATEDACESDALTKYDAAVAALNGCPPCLDATHRASLGAVVVAGEDVVVGGAYCASPGGAFIDAPH
jgi:hypothetical protein